MASHFPQKSFSDKQQGKRPMPSSNISHSQITKRTRTKVKVIKVTPDDRVVKKKYAKSQFLEALCHKVKHIVPKDSLQVYQEKFLNKLVDPEYYVDSSIEVELRDKFLKPFGFHHLLKLIGLNRKYNLVRTLTGVESRFKVKVIKFNYMDFAKYLGLAYDGYNMDISRSSNYDRIYFVLSISKSVCENPAMLNFGIS